MFLRCNSRRILAALALVLLLPVLACGRKSDTGNSYRESRLMMDTVVEVQAYGPRAEEGVRSALARLEVLDRLFDPHDPTSDVSRVNASAGLGPVKVSPDTVSLMMTALDISRRTGGAFDVTVGPLTSLWSFSEDHGPRVPGDEEVSRARAIVGYEKVLVNREQQTVELTELGMAVDFGAIAKGYAVGAAVEELKKAGITSALVSVGGSIFALGEKPGGGPWVVGIEHPRRPGQAVQRINVTGMAADTAADSRKFFLAGGRRYHHILDPSTGYPADNGSVSVTVISPDPVLADSLATAAFVLGPDRGKEVLASLPGVAALWLDQNGTVIATIGNVSTISGEAKGDGER